MRPAIRGWWAGAVLLGVIAGCGLLAPKATDPNHGAKIGAPCADSSKGGQSDCDPTQVCVAISKLNMCTVEGCQADSDCGQNGTFNNLCSSVGTDSSGNAVTVCARGCDPAVGNSCGRPDFICNASPTMPSVHFCSPDCRVQAATFCGYGTVCTAATGLCGQVECSTNSGCPTGYVCALADKVSLCALDCRNGGAACSAGRMCNSGGGCDSIVHKAWETCGAGVAVCDGGLKCVQIAPGAASLCYTKCAGDSDCAALNTPQSGTTACSVSLSDRTKVCLTSCYPGATTCPMNTACTQDQNLSGTYCETSIASGADAGM
jgi:hypothetical protein